MPTNQQRSPDRTLILSAQQWHASAQTTRGPSTPRIIPRVDQFFDPAAQSQRWWTLVAYPRLHIAARARLAFTLESSGALGMLAGPLVRVRVQGMGIVRFGFLRAAQTIQPPAPTNPQPVKGHER